MFFLLAPLAMAAGAKFLYDHGDEVIDAADDALEWLEENGERLMKEHGHHVAHAAQHLLR